MLAFNDLLKLDKGRRKDIAGIGFLYWLKNPADLNVIDVMDVADPAQVKKLLSFDPREDPDTNRFYMVAVSGNGGRLRVHHWADLALNQVKLNLQNWHRQLRVEYPRYAGKNQIPFVSGNCSMPWTAMVNQMTTPCWHCCVVALRDFRLATPCSQRHSRACAIPAEMTQKKKPATRRAILCPWPSCAYPSA